MRRPPWAPSGCVAEIRGAQSLADGRSNIVVQGTTRFLVTRYLDDPAPYLVAMVEAFEDRDGQYATVRASAPRWPIRSRTTSRHSAS